MCLYGQLDATGQICISVFVKMSEAEDVLRVKFDIIEDTLQSPFRDIFLGYGNGLVHGQPGGCVMSFEYAEHAEKIYKFKPRSDDVWVVTFPKCGTEMFYVMFL